MRSTILNGIGLLLILIWMSSPGLAVTVNIDVVSKGEPIPSTEISFETADGSAVKLETPPPATTTELVPEDTSDTAQETPSDSGTQVPTDAPQTPPNNATSTTVATDEPATANQTTPTDTSSRGEPQDQASLPDEDEETRPNIQQIVIPDEYVGKTLTMIIKKDGEVIKRQPLLIEPKEQQVPVEAFDTGDAKISVSVSQAKACRRGKGCDLYLDAKNEGAGIYKGPLFLAAIVPGTLPKAGTDDLACGLGVAGQYLCQALVSLEPRETQRWTIRLSLPGKLARNPSNCVEVVMPDPGKKEGQGSLVQAVQLGLQQKNLLQGRADGRSGPKTIAAIARFTNSEEAQPDFQQLYETIYDQDPRDAVRLGLGNGRSCQALKTMPEPVVKKQVAPSAKAKSVSTQKAKTQKKKQQAKSTKQQYDDDDDDESDFNPVGVGISIGLGSGMGGSKDRHRKKKKLEDVPLD